MSFSADWLSLRTDADERARSPALASRLADHFAGRDGLRILDLGAGHGSNMRLTGRHLPARQHWTLLDADADLLSRVEALEGVVFETRVVDLEGDLTPILTEDWDLVTASALFDLCGADWIDRFVAGLSVLRCPLYALLSYDGREEWVPSHREDAEVLAAFHADQMRDKGLGVSLGPNAHGYLAEGLHQAGYRVFEATSDWELDASRDNGLIAALAEATGAVASNPNWAKERHRASRVMIGHKDLLAISG